MLAAFAGAILFVLSMFGNRLERTRADMGDRVPGTTITDTPDGGFIHTRPGATP